MSNATSGLGALALGTGLVLAGAAGCPGSSASVPNGVAVYDGGISGTTVVAVSAFSEADAITILVNSPAGTYPALNFVAEVPGSALQAITYDSSNALIARTVVQEVATGGVVWNQSFDADTSVGGFSLTITDPGAVESLDGGIGWPGLQGTLTANLVPLGDVTDATISVLVSF